MQLNMDGKQESIEISDFLIFNLNKKKDGYILTGMKECDNVYEEIDFHIPEMYNGKPVVEIADKAFSSYWKDHNESTRCHFRRNLIIANTIKKIGKNAFFGVKFTGSLFLGNSLESIGASAFEDAFVNNNGSLIVPNSAKKIGRLAFRGCSGFNKLILGNAIEEIGALAFAETRFKYNWDSKPMNFNGEIIIPTSVKKIGVNAFNGCKNIVSLSVPKSFNLEIEENQDSLSFFPYIKVNNDINNHEDVDYFQSSSEVEQTIYYYVKKIFPDAINGYKPNWLKFPKTYGNYQSGNRPTGFELDMYIPSINAAIEYDSIKYHSKSKQIENDNRKSQLCIKNNVRLFRIIESGHKDVYKEDNNIYYKVGSNKRLKQVINQLLQVLTTGTKLFKISNIDFNKDSEDIYKSIDENYRKNRSLASKFPEICKYWDAGNIMLPDEIEISSKGFKTYLFKCPTCERKIFVDVWKLHEFSAFDIILDDKCSSCGEAIESREYEYIKKFYSKEVLSDFENRIVDNYLHRVVLLEMGNQKNINEKFLMYKKIGTLKRLDLYSLKDLIKKYIEDNLFIKNKTEMYRRYIPD